MLLYIFLVLGTWKGVLGEDDICDKPLYEVCPFPDDRRFPATRADVDRMCPQFIRNIDCVNNFSRKCRSESDPRQKYRVDFRALVEEACREDSQLYVGIVENVGCLHETVQNDDQACRQYVRESKDAMMERMDSIAAEKGYDEGILDDDIWTPYECLGHSLEAVCFATKSSARCGSDARDLILEIVRRSGFTDLYCAPANEERLAEYITLLELELEDKTSLNRILGRE